MLQNQLKSSTIKAEEYILAHRDENILGTRFKDKVKSITGASLSTIRKIFVKHNIKTLNPRREKLKQLSGEKYSPEEITRLTGYEDTVYLRTQAKKYGVTVKTSRGKYADLDITQYAGKSQAELARILGARVDAICRASKVYGWGKYLCPPNSRHSNWKTPLTKDDGNDTIKEQ